MKLYVTMNIDEASLLNESEQPSLSNLEEAISQEFGWLHDSGMHLESFSFDPPVPAPTELANEITVRVAHLAGFKEARQEIAEMEWDDLHAAIQDIIHECDENSARYLTDPDCQTIPSVNEVADRILKKRFPIKEKEMSSFYYTFGTSPSFPYQKGYIKVTAETREAADAVFRKNYPDKTPGLLNCSSIYNEEDFKNMLERNPDMPADWTVCHDSISQDTKTQKASSLEAQIISASFKKDAEQRAFQQKVQMETPERS